MFRCCCRCSNDNNNDNLKKQTLQLSSISKISDIFLLNDKNRSNNVVSDSSQSFFNDNHQQQMNHSSATTMANESNIGGGSGASGGGGNQNPNKKRGVLKWITNPVRKLSHGSNKQQQQQQIDKSSTIMTKLSSSSSSNMNNVMIITSQPPPPPLSSQQQQQQQNHSSTNNKQISSNHSSSSSTASNSSSSSSATLLNQNQLIDESTIVIDPNISTTMIVVNNNNNKTTTTNNSNHVNNVSTTIKSSSSTINDSGNSVGTGEEDCDLTEIEIPPPMAVIQEHNYQTIMSSSSTTTTKISQDSSKEIMIDEQQQESNIEQMVNRISLEGDDDSQQQQQQKEYSGRDNATVVGDNENETINEQNINNLDDYNDNDADDESKEKERALEKRKFVMLELIETERDYVQHLGMIVDDYIRLFRNNTDDICSIDNIQIPDDLKGGKYKIVFGNIENIHEWHKDYFLPELDRCIEEPARLGKIFRKYERRLNMYVVYCQNKPLSEAVVSDYFEFFEDIRLKLGHKLHLSDLLIKPVQRIMKYQLLLKDVLRCTEKSGIVGEEIDDLKKVVQIMIVVPKTANDMMMVSRLQNFDGKISAQGKLLQQGQLSVADIVFHYGTNMNFQTIKLKERQVFLFEQIIIFSEQVGQKTQFSNPNYLYKNHLQVNKMSLIPDKSLSLDPKQFILKSKDPQQDGLAFLCEGQTKDASNEWVSNIRAILDTQQDFLRALQSPIAYQKELTKEM